MRILEIGEIRRTERALDLEFKSGMVTSLENRARTKLETFKRSREEERKVKLLNMCEVGAKSMDAFGKIKNEAIKMGSNILTVTRTWKNIVVAVVGAGSLFSGAIGTNMKDTVRAASMDWTGMFMDKVKSWGVGKVLQIWETETTLKKLGSMR